MRYKGKNVGAIIIIIASLLFVGCSNSSLIVPYPSQISKVKNNIKNNSVDKAEKQLAGQASKGGHQQNLYIAELGRTDQIGGQYADSKTQFALAENIVEAQNMAAKVQIGNLVNSGLALLTNDNMQNYQFSGYEKIFLYNYQALNYLFLNDLSGALVEARRADDQQAFEATLNQKQAAALAQEKKKQDVSFTSKNYNKDYKAMLDTSQTVRNSYQNAYTFYITGLIYELKGDFTDALIDYKKALEIVPGNYYLKQKIVEMSQKSGRNYKDAAKNLGIKYATADKNSGELVVLYEQNFVPEKSSVNLPIIINGVIHIISLPIYAGPFQQAIPLNITNLNQNRVLGKTQKLVEVQALAAKALDEQMPMIMFREVLRFISKQVVTQKVSEENALAGAVMNIFGAVTSGADLRSWLTLPSNSQVFQQNMAEGTYDLNFSSLGSSKAMNLKIVSGKKTIIWIIQTDNQFYTKSITL